MRIHLRIRIKDLFVFMNICLLAMSRLVAVVAREELIGLYAV